MTMKCIQLKLHWDVDEVIHMIQLLDTLRETLCHTYDEELQLYRSAQHQQQAEATEPDPLDQTEFNF